MKENYTFSPADILLPKKGTDMSKWSCIACDQYTSEPEYWDEVRKYRKGSPSALNMILPEVYLGKGDTEKQVHEINSNMDKALESGLFESYLDSFIFVERLQTDGKKRFGIVGKIDLEKYDYNKGSNSEVRATEKTVLERIPPRVKIRENAPIELPHIMILIDDPENNVIGQLENSKNEFETLYDTDLSPRGGHITGRLVPSDYNEKIEKSLLKLGSPEVFEKKYNLPKGTAPLVFAMGDGNHSLATAKAVYENLKKENPGKDLSNIPARYALVEIVNLHSDALEFEAIHRFVSGVDSDKLIEAAKKELKLSKNGEGQNVTIISQKGEEKFYIGNQSSKLSVGSLQNFLDEYIKENGGDCDYIHGEENLRAIVKKSGGTGFILPAMKKEELFPTVIFDGALPRKTFSMGHADDKRFYMEARKIK